MIYFSAEPPFSQICINAVQTILYVLVPSLLLSGSSISPELDSSVGVQGIVLMVVLFSSAFFAAISTAIFQSTPIQHGIQENVMLYADSSPYYVFLVHFIHCIFPNHTL